MPSTLTSTQLPEPRKQGKVRDIYDLGDTLLFVATDRISVFDVVLPTGIPDKGVVLTELSRFWFERTGHIVSNHLLAMGRDTDGAHRYAINRAAAKPLAPGNERRGSDEFAPFVPGQHLVRGLGTLGIERTRGSEGRTDQMVIRLKVALTQRAKRQAHRGSLAGWAVCFNAELLLQRDGLAPC